LIQSCLTFDFLLHFCLYWDTYSDVFLYGLHVDSVRNLFELTYIIIYLFFLLS